MGELFLETESVARSTFNGAMRFSFVVLEEVPFKHLLSSVQSREMDDNIFSLSRLTPLSLKMILQSTLAINVCDCS